MNILWRTTLKLLLVSVVCIGMLGSCGDDDDNNYEPLSESIASTDPSYGYMWNNTRYTLQIDFGEVEEFNVTLAPGAMMLAQLTTDRTYIMHVVVMNSRMRVVSEYINALYVDNIPLDNQFRDFVCSWFVEFTPNYPEYGYANNFGS